MRLLHTLTTYPPSVGGAQLHQHLLGKALSQHQLQVVTYWSQNRTDWLLGTTIGAHSQPYDYQIGHIPVHRLGIGLGDKLAMATVLPLYYPCMPWAVKRLAGRLYPYLEPYVRAADLVHNVRIGREVLSYASLKLARKYDIPFVLTPVHHPRWTGWRYRVYLALYRQADGVFALTQAEKQILIGLGVAPERIYVIGHGPVVSQNSDGHGFCQRYGIQGPMVLFLGQHYPYKGYQALLAAAPKIWRRFPAVQFVFIGPAVKSSEQAFAGADSRIHRLGAVDLQTKTDALGACDILCVPSTQESFGGVYTEAWSFRKPVIGCNIPAVAEVIEDGVSGLLVEQSPEEIADGLLELLTQPNLARSMGEAGYQKVQQQYAWAAIGAKADRAYRKILMG